MSSTVEYNYYSIKYKDESIAIRAKTKEEAIEKFHKYYPNETIVSIHQVK